MTVSTMGCVTVFAPLVLVFAISQWPNAAAQAAVIDRAKNTIVQDIDKALPRSTVEVWLRGLVGPTPAITWEVNDCGEQTGSPADRGRDLPVCVEIGVARPGKRQLFLSLGVGSVGRGTTGAPAFYHGVVVGPSPTDMVWIKTLGQVPERLAELKPSCDTVRHPQELQSSVPAFDGPVAS